MPDNVPVNKTQAIREYLAAHPGASPKEVAAALAAQGILVSNPYLATLQAATHSPSPRESVSEALPRHVPFEVGKRFYKLYGALCAYVNQKLDVVPDLPGDLDHFVNAPPELRMKVRDALYAHRELIDQFVQENPFQLSAEELAIVSDWKFAVVGSFVVFRYLANHAVFLNDTSPAKAYGVQALASSFEEVVGPHLPVMVQGVLLPMQGRIIYDGLLSRYSISFGPGIRRMQNEKFKKAKAAFGIITSLPEGSSPPVAKKAASRKKPAVARGPADVKGVLETIVQMTDAFCRDHLNDEYARLCRDLAGTLSRKRPSPLLKGQLESWASGIVRTIGWLNFLDDPSQSPHLKLPVIDRAFGVSESTGQQKSKAIRRLLKIGTFDPKWTLPSKLDGNPMIWTLSINGFLMDIRNAPRELQVEAFRKGLIPYIPADRDGDLAADE